MSKPLVGSSRNVICGFVMSSAPTAVRLRSPPEMPPELSGGQLSRRSLAWRPSLGHHPLLPHPTDTEAQVKAFAFASVRLFPQVGHVLIPSFDQPVVRLSPRSRAGFSAAFPNRSQAAAWLRLGWPRPTPWHRFETSSQQGVPKGDALRNALRPSKTPRLGQQRSNSVHYPCSASKRSGRDSGQGVPRLQPNATRA